MLFQSRAGRVLAISQPAHAAISGQILAAWQVPLEERLRLAAEQHDIAWLDWETAPSFDPATGRPHLFRAIGAAAHAPMWQRGVARALHAWGRYPALLISRHGGVIYRRFSDRHRVAAADADAAERFLAEQAPVEAAWAEALALDPAALDRASALLAFADQLSLAFCGELALPLSIEAPGLGPVRVAEADEVGEEFSLEPWPFRSPLVRFEAEAIALPESGRFPDERAMRAWLADDARRTTLRITARKLD